MKEDLNLISTLASEHLNLDYRVNGKLYIAIACGSEILGTKKGNKIIAFSLE
ncbi:MAG: hypothetical protein R2814_01890 [Flavobacteriaceae bacterium]